MRLQRNFLTVIYRKRTWSRKPQNAQLGKKIYVEQEIEAVIHTCRKAKEEGP
jgi:hypothetical protein